MKVAILTTSFGEDPRALEILRKKGLNLTLNPHKRKVTGSEVIQLASDADGVISGLEEIDSEVLGKLWRLKVISRCGVGLDNVDLEATKARGIRVFNTPDAVTPAVAELTVGLMLDLLRKTPRMDQELRTGNWNKKMGSLLQGKKVGVVGFGRIGRHVAKLCLAFGAEAAFSDPANPEPLAGTTAKSLEELLGWADILTLHASQEKPSTLIGASELSRMKNGAWFVNTSRGGLLDEGALYEALRSGRLSGAALDVFAKEPYDGPLGKLENTVLTPHIGSYAKEARARMELEAAQNLLKGLGL